MGKMATGFRDLAELREWDYSGQDIHECYGMDYVWILCIVDSKVQRRVMDRGGKWIGTGDFETETSVEPCRFFISTKSPVIVDNFGNDRVREIVAWKPIPQLVNWVRELK